VGAGQLRESVTFQRQGVGALNSHGNKGQAWANIASLIAIAAQLKPLRANEQVNAQGVTGLAVYEVLVRHTAAAAGVRVGDRMVDARSGVMYNVKSPPTNQDMHRKYLKILVEWGGADG